MGIRNSLGVKEMRIATGFALAMTMTDSVILNGTQWSEESFLDSSLSRLAANSFCPSLSFAQKLRLRKFRAAFFCHRQRRPEILRMTFPPPVIPRERSDRGNP